MGGAGLKTSGIMMSTDGSIVVAVYCLKDRKQIRRQSKVLSVLVYDLLVGANPIGADKMVMF